MHFRVGGSKAVGEQTERERVQVKRGEGGEFKEGGKESTHYTSRDGWVLKRVERLQVKMVSGGKGKSSTE